MKVPITYSDRHAERLEIRHINKQMERWDAVEHRIWLIAAIGVLTLILIAML